MVTARAVYSPRQWPDLHLIASQTLPTTAELLAGYKRHLRARGLAANTVRNYVHDVSAFAAERDLLMVTRADVRTYLLTLREIGVAPASASRIMSTLRLFYVWCVGEGIIESSPLAGVGSLPKIPHILPAVLSVDEVAKLLWGPVDPRERALLEFLYATGARVSEVCALNVADIDFRTRICRVMGKGNKEREVLFGGPCATALREYLAQRHVVATIGESALFINRDGLRLSVRSAQNIVAKWGRWTLRREDIHPHTLRHSYATHMLDNGADLRVVQHLLGHECADTTALYWHVTAHRQQETYREAWQHRGEHSVYEWAGEDDVRADPVPEPVVSLEPRQATALEAIRRDPGKTRQELAALLRISSASISRRLSLLKAGGHIVVSDGAGDKGSPERYRAAHGLPIVRTTAKSIRWK